MTENTVKEQVFLIPVQIGKFLGGNLSFSVGSYFKYLNNDEDFIIKFAFQKCDILVIFNHYVASF